MVFVRQYLYNPITDVLFTPLQQYLIIVDLYVTLKETERTVPLNVLGLVVRMRKRNGSETLFGSRG